MEKKNRQYFTRKNLIAFSLVTLFSILLIFVSLCVDHSDAMSFISSKNPLAQLAAGLGFRQIDAGIYGITCVALVAVYCVIFTVALVFEMRLAHINGKSHRSLKMILIYIATLVVCLALSVGLGLIIQPQITAENVVNHLVFLAQSLVVALICYIGIGAIVGAVTMLIVNFRKVNKPFDFFQNDALDDILTAEEITPVSTNFDEPQESANVSANTVAGGALDGVAAVGGGVGVAAVQELEDREKVFPALSALDIEYEGYTAEKLESDDVSLKELCEGFRNYLAKYEHLYYDIQTIRVFISSLNATRLILLEGLSGTGKSSLPRYFAKYVGGKATFLAVQATWRDRTNLLGYFNDFSKTYSETDFLTALYEANYDTDRINVFVLDELNISRVEYYFADFLSVLEYPSDEWKLRVMHLPVGFLPPVKLEEGNIKIPLNTYFVGTANKDDSTFSIADKVYDRALTIDFDNRNASFVPEGNAEPITLGVSKLQSLFDDVKQHPESALTADDLNKFTKITDFIYDEFDAAYGNRVLNQIETLVPTYITCGGTKEEVLDFVLASKVLVKLEGRFEDYIKGSLKQLSSLIESVYGAGTFVRSEKLIENLLKKL